MSLKSNIVKLVTRWRYQDIEMLPPFSKAVVHQVFNDIGAHATDDVVALYESLGGMPNMNEDNWRIWSLQEISDANHDLAAFGVIFSDYLLDCYHFRLKPVSEAVSEVWVDGFDNGPPVCVAKSLDDFIERYIISPESVLNAPYRPTRD
ncbi:MAG: hypothetical protein V4495_30355 [Pseudomonadota bacterium]